jgi:hypothetical protein
MRPSPEHTRFWQWFRDHGDRLRTAMYSGDVASRDAATDELREAAQPVAPELVLEVARGGEGQPHTLVVSADGRPERVDAVKDFVDSAPTLPGWKVVAFRSRMEIGDHLEIALEGERVGAEDIWFRVAEDEGGLDLTLHVRGLTPANENLRGLGASLLAEHAVGERDALTMIGALRVQPLPPEPATTGLRPFRDLVGVFDAAKATRYPAPGTLPVPVDNWLHLGGTINGALASILLHGALRPWAGHPAYDRRLTVSIRFNQSRQDGMPGTEEEFQTVGDLGDRLSEALQEGQQSLLALTVTTQGKRDMVFYTANAGPALLRLEELRNGIRSHRIKAAIERDTYWGMYRSFLRASEEAGEEGEE